MSHLAKQESLLSLPNELLHEICRLATSRHPFRDRRHRHLRTAAALSRCCRLLHEIVIPFLYQAIDLRYHVPTNSFLERGAYKKHCRQLLIPDQLPLSHRRYLEGCDEVKSIFYDGAYYYPVWQALVHYFATSNKIKTFGILNAPRIEPVLFMCMDLDLPNLVSLQVELLLDVEFEEYPSKDVQSFLGLQRSSAVTSLCVHCTYLKDPMLLGLLLEWPRALTTLSLQVCMETSRLQSLLDLHSHSLTEIRVLALDLDKSLDFSAFESLKTVHICTDTIKNPINDEVSITLGPVMTMLSFDVFNRDPRSSRYRQETAWEKMGNYLIWILTIASNSCIKGTSLQKIRLRHGESIPATSACFCAEPLELVTDLENKEWPEYLRSAAENVKAFGIKFEVIELKRGPLADIYGNIKEC